MPRIHLLPDHLVSQIAAGEVVERPASVQAYALARPAGVRDSAAVALPLPPTP